MSANLFRVPLLIGVLSASACSDPGAPAVGPKPVSAAVQAVAGPPGAAARPTFPPSSTTPLGPDHVTSPEPPRDLGGVLPLKHGIFVAADVPCESPPNAAIRRYDGQGLSGAHTRACRAKVLSKRGSTYEVDQSCIDAGAGPAPRSSERQTITIADNLDFTLTRGAGSQRFRYCPAALLPPGIQ
jgi:hypothetical protein